MICFRLLRNDYHLPFDEKKMSFVAKSRIKIPASWLFTILCIAAMQANKDLVILATNGDTFLFAHFSVSDSFIESIQNVLVVVIHRITLFCRVNVKTIILQFGDELFRLRQFKV